MRADARRMTGVLAPNDAPVRRPSARVRQPATAPMEVASTRAGVLPRRMRASPFAPSLLLAVFVFPSRTMPVSSFFFSYLFNPFNLGMEATVEMPLGYRYDTPRDPTYRPGDSRHFK